MTKRVLSGFMAALFVAASAMALVGCGEEAATVPGVTKPAPKATDSAPATPATTTKP